MAADAPQVGATTHDAPGLERPAASRQDTHPAQLKLDPLESSSGDRGAGAPERAVTLEPALRESEARIRKLEQQIKELKGLLAQRDQRPAVQAQDNDAGAATAGSGPPQGSYASALSSSVNGSRGDPAPASVQTVSDRSGGSAAQGAHRERPAILQTTEGMVLAVLLLLALGSGFALLLQLRRSASAGPVIPDSQWPSELRAARDAINRAAGRDAELERRSETERLSEGKRRSEADRQSEAERRSETERLSEGERRSEADRESGLEKAVAGRFSLPKLDFVEGLGSPASTPSQGSGSKEGAGSSQVRCSAIGPGTDSKSPLSGRG